MSNLTELEKIAASLDEEFSGMVKQANPSAVSEGYQPAVGLEPTQTNQEMANEMQGGQEPVQPLTDEELQLQQQLGLEQQQEIEQAEQIKEQERAQVDRALLEGAAGEAIQQMEDDELRDILIEKAASEMYGLSAFAHLIDLSTSNDVDGQIVKEAGEILDYMSTSTEAFNDGINKVANLLFNDKPEQTIATFSNDGVHYVFEQLAKLEDFDTLEKVAHETSATALYKIAMNEGEGISASVDVLAEAYNQGIEDATLAVAKEKVVEELMNNEMTHEEEQLAYNIMEAFEKTAGPFKNAKRTLDTYRSNSKKAKRLTADRDKGMKDTSGVLSEDEIQSRLTNAIDSANRRANHAKGKIKKAVGKGAVGVGVGGVGLGGVGLAANKISNGRKQSVSDYEEEQLAYAILDAFEKTAGPKLKTLEQAGKRAKELTATAKNKTNEVVNKVKRKVEDGRTISSWAKSDEPKVKAPTRNANKLNSEERGTGLKARLQGALAKERQHRADLKSYKENKAYSKRLSGIGDANNPDKSKRSLQKELLRDTSTNAELSAAKRSRNRKIVGGTLGTAGLAGVGSTLRNEEEKLAYNIMEAFEKTAGPFSKAVEAGKRYAPNVRNKGEEVLQRGKQVGNSAYNKGKSQVEEVKEVIKRRVGKNQTEPNAEKRKINGKKVGLGVAGAGVVGASGFGIGRATGNRNQGEHEEEQLAFSLVNAIEKTAGYPNFFNLAESNELAFRGHEKSANFAGKVTNGIMKNVDRVKNLKNNTALMKDLTGQQKALKNTQGVDINDSYNKLKEAQRIVGELADVKRDVAVGRTLAYGVPASAGTAGLIAAGSAIKRNKAQVMPEETDELSKQASFNGPLTHLQNIKRLGQQVVSKGNLLAKRNGDEGLALATSQLQFDNPIMSDLQTGNALKGNVEGFRNGSFVERKMIEYGANALPNVMERLAFDMVQPPSPPAGMPTSAPTITHKPLTPSQPHNLKPVNDKTPMTKPGAVMKTITPENNIQGY